MSVSTNSKASKTLHQSGFVSHYVLLAIGLVIVVIVAGYTYQRVFLKTKTNTNPTTTSSNTPASTEESVAPVKLKTVSVESPKMEIQVPEDWVVSKGGDYTFIKGTDSKSGLEAQIGISANNYQPVGCTVVDSNSQLLSYDNPTSVQRKQTHLTYLNISDDLTCTMVITGAKSYKKGDVLDNKPSASPSEKSLPSDLITVAINKLESSTLFPKHEDLLKSNLHSQIINALKSIRIS